MTAHRTVLSAAAGVAAVATLCLGLVGCRPEPAPSSAPSPTSSASASPSSSPSPSETAQAGEDIDLPTACEQIYSPAMLASLQQQAPLNDPGVTMTSTQNVEALEILTSGIPTIRCTWGAPSETGLATNVSIVAADQAATIAGALVAAGFACTPVEEGSLCTWEQTMISLDDVIAELTETHFLRGNAWVATYTINFEAEGYTEDIIATLWG